MRAEENRIHVAPFLVLGEEGMNGDGYICDVRFGHPNRETSDQTHPVAVKANARGACSMVRIPMSCAAKGDETFLFSYACNDDDTNHWPFFHPRWLYFFGSAGLAITSTCCVDRVQRSLLRPLPALST